LLALLASLFDVAIWMVLLSCEMAAGLPLRQSCLLLKAFVTLDVDSLVFQLEASVVATVIAWWKVFAENARYFMRLPVLRVVNNRINTGCIALIPGLKNISYVCHVGLLVDLPAGSWKNRITRAALP
jgi:hypothetical protein